MENKDWIFEKWPVALRWILFVPLSVVAYFISALLALIGNSFMGYNINAPIIRTAQQVVGFIGHLFVIYTCVPKAKEIITGIYSLLWSAFCVAIVILSIIRNTWYNWDFAITIISGIIFIIVAVNMLIAYGKNLTSNKNETLNT